MLPTTLVALDPGELGADGLAGDEIAAGQAFDAGGQHVCSQSQFLGQLGLGGAGTTEHKQHRIVARFETLLDHGHQQRLVRELTGFDEPIERGAGRGSGHRRENSPISLSPSIGHPSYR